MTDRSAHGNPYLFTGRRYDPETELYYYRARYMQPETGRFISRDPFGIWGDPVNLGSATTYVGNNPWTHTDPYGDITVTRVSFQKWRCGGFQVKWIFKLDRAAFCDGYIVQEINYTRVMAPCNGAPAITKKHYWESWHVSKGKQLEDLHGNFGYTDMAQEPSHPNHCGVAVQTGKIKFFCSASTGDLGRDGQAPAQPNDGWGPGAEPMAGGLPSTRTKPPWWDRPWWRPLSRVAGLLEKDASRFAGSLWDCCRTPELNIVTASP